MSRGGQNHWIVGIVLACTLGLVSIGYAQMTGAMGGGMVAIPGTSFGGATDPSMLQVTDGFRVIPSIIVGQRYDSNVFYAPKTAGLNPEDFVTTTIPQIRGLYAGNLGKVNAMASAVGEYYAKNTGLSYVGANAGAVFDVSQLASRLWEGTQLMVADAYSYTPQPPAFLTGDLTGGGGNPFVRGIQVGRTNTQSNNLSASLTVPLNQVVGLTGSYTNSFIKFGQSEVQQPGALIDTKAQTYMAGLSMKASPQDTVSLNSINSEFDSGAQGTFSAHGGAIGWLRLFTPNVSLNSTAGAQLVETKFSGFSSSTTIAPVGSLALLWKDRTTAMTVAYSLGVTPSYEFQSQALHTHVASVSITQQTAISELLGVASLNFGRGGQLGAASAATDSSAFSYVSWGGSGGFTYRFTPKTFLGLIYSYANYNSKFGGATYAFDRSVVQLTLSQAFY